MRVASTPTTAQQAVAITYWCQSVNVVPSLRGCNAENHDKDAAAFILLATPYDTQGFRSHCLPSSASLSLSVCVCLDFSRPPLYPRMCVYVWRPRIKHVRLPMERRALPKVCPNEKSLGCPCVVALRCDEPHLTKLSPMRRSLVL